MNKSIRKFLATLFVFSCMALLPASCGLVCRDSCGCGPKFEVKDFTILSFETLSLTNTGQRVNPSTPLPFSQIFKAFRILQTQTLSSSETLPASGMPGVAFACSPIPPKSAQTMTGVQILNLKEVTLGDGTLLQVGQDLTENFEINYFFADKTLPMETFFKQPVTVYREDIFKLKWTKDPKKEVILEFSIRISMSEGKEFILNNEVMSIRE